MWIKESVVAALRDDSGFILRGGWAAGFLIFMFVMALLGALPWESFGATLAATVVLTGIGYATSAVSSPKPHAR